MSSLSAETNAALLRKVKSLSPETILVFKNTFSKAPLMLAFLNFLEAQKQPNFKTNAAVYSLYYVKNTEPNYAQFENRFFKLRKKMQTYFTSHITTSHSQFTQQELLLQEIKELSSMGKYQEARPLIISLEEKLWRDNIFELLPELLDILVHNNQVLRKIELNEVVYKRMDKANHLHTTLVEAKKLARQIYDANIITGIKSTTALFQKLQRISIQQKAYPRFKLIYNLISATCKLAGGGLDFKPDFKITNRFITTIHQIHDSHPLMPDYRFTAGYSDTQNYLFENLRIMNHFNAFQFREAANLMKSLFDSVVASDSTLQRMRGVVFYSTSCLVLNAGERYSDALQVALAFLSYLKEIKQTENLPTAYIEIITAYIWLYPTKIGFTNSFIDEKLEEYFRYVKSREYGEYYLAFAKWVKVKVMLVRGEYKSAEKLVNATNFTIYFQDEYLEKELKNSIQFLLNKEVNKNKIKLQISNLHALKLRSKTPPDYLNYFFLEKVLQQYLTLNFKLPS